MKNLLHPAALAALLFLQGPPAHALDGIRVTLLGTAAPEMPGGAPGPSALLEAGEETLIFDCGPGTRARLEQAGVPVRDLTAMFLSTLDPRRLEGCRELWRARAGEGGGGPLPVWGPNGTADLVGQFETASGLTPQSAAIGFDIVDNVVYQPEGVTVTAFVTDSGSLPSYGYRVDAMRRSVTLSGSTRYSENVARYARGVHLLLHEVAAGAGPDAAGLPQAHTSPEDAARIFRTARPYLAVYSQMLLIDVTPEDLLRRTRNLYRGAVEVGRDLLVIEIENEVQIRSAPSESRRTGTP